MKQLIYKYAGLFLITLLMAGCRKEPNYPKEPQIEFKEITARTYVDPFNQAEKVDITITVKFKDGDGNLGLDASPQDSLPPYNYQTNPFNRFHYNYFAEPFIEKNGKFEPYNLFITLNGRFPLLNPDGKIRDLEGDLRYTTGFFINSLPANFKSGDRMKFKVSIADRALNESNTIETEPVQIFFDE